MFKKVHLLFSFSASLLLLFSLFTYKLQAQTVCPAVPSSPNAIKTTVRIPIAGTYQIWSRMLVPNTINNSYFFQIDNGCALVIGDAGSMSRYVWNWINFQNGSVTNKASAFLTAGDHVVTLTEREGGVELDRIILTQNTSCTPIGTGDNCETSATPVITVIASPSAIPSVTPSVASRSATSTVTTTIQVKK
jgi:hypothetical protein